MMLHLDYCLEKKTEEAQGQTFTSLKDFTEYKEVKGVLIPLDKKLQQDHK